MDTIMQEKKLLRAESRSAAGSHNISRLDFVNQLTLILGGVCAGCSPVKILLKCYPDKFKQQSSDMDDMLRAFVVTVIPGAPIDNEHLIRVFHDDYYPFSPYTGFFLSDLAQRSQELFQTEKFCELSLAQRTRVVQAGLKADATVARLYRGAILLAQVSFYAGIYDDEKGCPLVDFHGSNSGFSEDAMYYMNPVKLLACEATTTGNYV